MFYVAIWLPWVPEVFLAYVQKPETALEKSLAPRVQFGSEHVAYEDVHIFKHCHEMTGFCCGLEHTV